MGRVKRIEEAQQLIERSKACMKDARLLLLKSRKLLTESGLPFTSDSLLKAVAGLIRE